MDPFSYICVLTSIVAGLAVTRLVSGFGQLLQTRARTPPYWVHALWMVNVLLTMIITWWVQYRWRDVPHWTLFLFLWLLVAPLILYLVAALLFPTNQDDVVVTSWRQRSEEHTSELQSRLHLVCRLLLEKKKKFLLPYSCLILLYIFSM